jgi:hypothetical protein
LSSIEINIFEGTLPSTLNVNVLHVRLPSFSSNVEQQEFLRSLFASVRKRANGFFHKDKIYFLGNEDIVLEDVNPLLIEHDGFEILSSSQATLQLPNHLPVVRSLLYSAFEAFLQSKGFVVRPRKRGDKIAIPSFEALDYGQQRLATVEITMTGDVPVYLHEAFFYRLHFLGGNKINLVIDPKIQVLVPAQQVRSQILERAYLSTICLHDSSQAGPCDLVRNNSVKFVAVSSRSDDLPATKCVRMAKEFYEVKDVKRQENLVLPCTILFVEGHPANLGISTLVRGRSLKKSAERRDLTLAFVKHLSDGGQEMLVPLGLYGVKIHATPKMLPIVERTPSGPLQEARVLGEPRLIFTNTPMYVSPREGLMQEGPYSRNNSKSVYHPETITLHIIYPKSSEFLVRSFVEALHKGRTGYPGFSADNPPFYSEIQALYYPLTNATALGYKSELATLRDKVDKKGHVVVVVLPESLEAYLELKALCFQHGMSSQFIKNGTIQRALSSTALQFYLWNFAVALYAKAGGTPWRIDSSLLQHTDCYIGIQTKIQQTARAGPSAFFVGAADIFNSFGEYLSCAVHQDMAKTWDGLHVDSEFMKNLVMRAIDRYRATTGLHPSKIIIHRQLDFDRDEMQGLAEGLEQAGTTCPCFVVHFQEGHHFRGYVPQSQDFIVERTTYFPLGKASAVLFTTGMAQGRYEGGLGTPKPTQVNVKVVNSVKQIGLKDIEDVCNSLIGFTRLRWNSTRIGIRRPLTIFAADKIGEMAKSGFTNLQYRDIRDFL